MKKKVSTGYCNCKSDTWQTNRKTPYLQFVRDTYHKVRVDCDGLCFLCANHAMVSKLDKGDHGNRVNFLKEQEGDLTIGIDNPEGIFNERR